MNNIKAELSSVPNDSAPAVRRSHPRVTRTDDPIRDFFRRGDRGQYEGGAAERIDGIPSLDLPDKKPLVRTPEQEARRRALIRLEAVLLAGCLGLLVLAARAKSMDAGKPGDASAARLEPRRNAQPAREMAIQGQPAMREPARPAAPPPPPKADLKPALNTPAPIASISVEPSVVSIQTTHPRSESTTSEAPATPQVKQARVTRETPKPTAAPAVRTSQSHASDTSLQASPAPAKISPAPKRAVAAFPDD